MFGQVTAGLILFVLFASWYLQINPAYLLDLWSSESNTESAKVARHDLNRRKNASVEIAVGKATASLAGQLPSFHAESTHVTLGDIPCELLILDAADVEFNVEDVLKGEKVRILSFSSADLTLQINSNVLKANLIPLFEKKGLRDVHIDFGTGTVKVTARRRVRPFGRMKMSAKGEFYIFGGNGIGLRLREFETGQLNIGVSRLAYSVEQRVPPLDLGGMYAEVVIDKLSINSQRLLVTAHAEKLQGDGAPRDVITVF